MGTGEVRDFREPPKKSQAGGVRILGGARTSQPGEVQKMDKKSKVEQVPPVVVKHEEVITVKEHTRRKPKKGDPEVRVRHANREAFEKAKRS